MGIFDSMFQFASDALTNGVNWFSQQQTNEMNERLMRESWARDDTAMQRKVADLEAAGLNPVLAAGGQGSPNSGPIRLGAPQLSGIDMGRVFGASAAHAQADIGQANVGAAEAGARIADINSKILQEQYRFRSDLVPGDNSVLVTAPLMKQIADYQKAVSDASKAYEDAKAAEADAAIKARTNKLLDKYQEAQIIAGLAGEGIGAAVQGLKGGLLLGK